MHEFAFSSEARAIGIEEGSADLVVMAVDRAGGFAVQTMT